MDKSTTRTIRAEQIKGAAEEIPFYLPVADEIEVFEAAQGRRLPVLLKGPTGCGKTRFVRHMAHRLGLPLYTVSCHDDLTSTDLVGRYIIKGGETLWVDGPLTRAVREGGICYLDEVVEARKDTTVIIHPLADDRRVLVVEKTGEELEAPESFILIVSYNPGYQHILKDLKPSTRQRFVSLEFDYPPGGMETEIVVKESGLEAETAARLISLGQKMRGLACTGLENPPGTRLLVNAALLIESGLGARTACEAAIVRSLTDDEEVQKAMMDLVDAVF